MENVEQLSEDEARILLELLSRPRTFQGTIDEMRKMVDAFEEIRRKLSVMSGVDPNATDSQPQEQAQTPTIRGTVPKRKRK